MEQIFTPRRHYLIPRLPVFQQELGKLRAIGIFRRKSLQKDPALVLEEQREKDEHTKLVVPKIIDDLQNINKSKNSTLVLVLLPHLADYTGKSSEEWRQFLHAQAEEQDFIFIDLIDEFRTYPPQEVGSLFGNHYSPKGNEYIANILYKKLLTFPEVARKLKDT